MSIYYVKAYYGPSTSFNTCIHKPHHLKGFRFVLQQMGYRVDLVPVNYVNYCMLQVCGHRIFRCNIQNLHFNTVAYRDTVCQRAIEAVLDATRKIQNARTYLYFLYLLDDQLFLRGKYSYKDKFISEVNIKPYADVMDCAKCCGIPLAPKHTQYTQTTDETPTTVEKQRVSWGSVET